MREFTPEEHETWLKSLPGMPASAAMILEDQRGGLLIVKAGYRQHWTMPGGLIDEGESPLEAAVREVSEEVGVAIEPGAAQFVSIAYRHSKARDTYQFIFKASVSSQQAETIKLQESEIEAYAFVSKEQVMSGDRIYAPAIIDWASGRSGYIELDIDALAKPR